MGISRDDIEQIATTTADKVMERVRERQMVRDVIIGEAMGRGAIPLYGRETRKEVCHACRIDPDKPLEAGNVMATTANAIGTLSQDEVRDWCSEIVEIPDGRCARARAISKAAADCKAEHPHDTEAFFKCYIPAFSVKGNPGYDPSLREKIRIIRTVQQMSPADRESPKRVAQVLVAELGPEKALQVLEDLQARGIITPSDYAERVQDIQRDNPASNPATDNSNPRVRLGEAVYQEILAGRRPEESMSQTIARLIRRELRVEENLLTPAQHDVLALAAEGLSNRQIANKLFISIGTVRVHLSDIRRQVGVPTREEAVAAFGKPTVREKLPIRVLREMREAEERERALLADIDSRLRSALDLVPLVRRSVERVLAAETEADRGRALPPLYAAIRVFRENLEWWVPYEERVGLLSTLDELEKSPSVETIEEIESRLLELGETLRREAVPA